MKTSHGITTILRATLSTNPRKVGTVGHKSYAILLAAGGTMAYGAYLKAGGRPEDANWDRARGWALLGDETPDEAYANVPKASRAGLLRSKGQAPASPATPDAFSLAVSAVLEENAKLEASYPERGGDSPAEILAAHVDALAEAKERKQAKKAKVA